MAFENEPDRVEEVERTTAQQFAGGTEPGEIEPWEQIGTGRYLPRRIKGSCKGRALG
ncbi:MAG TPA: hypothetical protein VKU02_27975 [Gemmataceae bacterium]|nr:hypothetical protein [Gemmataceae bacterium]